VTALYTACKVDEVYVPRIGDFAMATDGCYQEENIVAMELRLMQILLFKLHPVTLCNWANWYLNMWDVYATQTLLPLYPPGTDLTFKGVNEAAYQRYRVFFQVLDMLTLSSDSI
jgi:hypothetical protein